MNYHLACSSALLCSFLASGCSSNAVKQTHDVSATALAYTTVINELLEVTKERAIEIDSRQLLMSRVGNTKEKLRQKDKAMDEWNAEVDQLKEQNVKLNNYFKLLQAMVDSPTHNDMSSSLGSISDSISLVNQTQARSRDRFEGNHRLSYEQVDNVSSLSKVLISAHYAGRVRSTLQRDRLIIAKQIKLQQRQLDKISSIYRRNSRFDNKDHYKNQVEGPFTNKGQDRRFNDYNWIQNRRKYFANKEAVTIFKDVKKANKAFQEAWICVLEGKQDVGAVKAILGDVNKFVKQAYQLHDRAKNPYTGSINLLAPETMQ